MRLGMFLGACVLTASVIGMLIYSPDSPPPTPYESCTRVAYRALELCVDQIDEDSVEIHCIEGTHDMLLECTFLLEEKGPNG